MKFVVFLVEIYSRLCSKSVSSALTVWYDRLFLIKKSSTFYHAIIHCTWSFRIQRRHWIYYFINQ